MGRETTDDVLWNVAVVLGLLQEAQSLLTLLGTPGRRCLFDVELQTLDQTGGDGYDEKQTVDKLQELGVVLAALKE